MKQNYRNSDPSTSQKAGNWITQSGKRETQCERIFKIIQLCQPISTDAIAGKLGIPHPNPVSKRVSDLLNQDRIFVVGEITGRSGHKVQMYKVNPDPKPYLKKRKLVNVVMVLDDMKRYARDDNDHYALEFINAYETDRC